VVKIYSDSIKTLDDSEDCIFSKASMNLHVSFFKEALCLIEEILPQGMVHFSCYVQFVFHMMTL
jgi:endoribonuclease Dicer